MVAVVHEAIDLAGQAHQGAGAAGMGDLGGNRHLGAAAGAEQWRQGGVLQHGQRLGCDVLADLHREAGQRGSPGRPRLPRASSRSESPGRCSSRAWVSVPRRNRPSSASATGGRMGGSAGGRRFAGGAGHGILGFHFKRRQTRRDERHGEHRLARCLGLRPRRQRRRRHGHGYRAIWQVRAWWSGRWQAATRRGRRLL